MLPTRQGWMDAEHRRGADPGLLIIALIGPSGAGKSEIARRLAEVLHRPLMDTDAMVEQRDGRSVSEIFSEDSEAAFRAKEAWAVQQAAATLGAVVACGGGVVLDPHNVEALRSSGEVFYLKTSPDVAAGRIGLGSGRPLLDGGAVRDKIARMIEERGSLYENAAHHVVDADGQPGDVVDALVRIWESVAGPRAGFTSRRDPSI